MAELSSEHWKRVERCFSAAADMDAPDRRRYLDELAKSDPAVCIEVKSLLKVHSVAGSFLEDSAFSQLTVSSHGDVRAVASRARGPDDPMIGRILGRYRIVRLIARGGMGSVYLAERADEEFEQQAALKLIRPLFGGSGARSQDLLDRFHNERQVLANLSHPNIARLLDGGSAEAPGFPEGLPYLVMEYVKGERIDDYCDARRLTIERRIELFRTVCEAVQHAHRNLVIHRDLKPSNILVTEDGTVKLLDFGIARMLHPSDGDAAAGDLRDVTVTAERRLTPAYASPEQILRRPCTTASDVYSLGVVLYELLSGRRPYRLRRGTEAELEQAICEQPPTRPSAAVLEQLSEDGDQSSTVGPDALLSDRRPPGSTTEVAALRRSDPARLVRKLRGDLETILLTALAKEPERRYASAGMLAEDLGRCLRHEPIVARPPSAAYVLRKFVHRHLLLSAAATVMVLGLIVAVVGTSVGLVHARTATAEAQRQSRIASAVNTFLNQDLLLLASPIHNPDRGMTIEDALDIASRKIEDGTHAFADEPLVEATIRETLAGAYYSLGAYQRAFGHAQHASEFFERAQGPSSESALRNRSLIAASLSALGRDDDAIEMAREVLALQSKILGETHADTTQTALRLAWALASAGEYAEAESIYQDAIERAEHALGPDHPAVLSALGSLGDLRGFQRRYDEAEALLTRALEGQRRTYGSEHPVTIMAMNKLGAVLLAKGRFEEADDLLVSALEASRRVLGDHHDQTAVVASNVGRSHFLQDRPEEAEAHYSFALRIFRETDPHHTQTLSAAHNLAGLYCDMARFDEALSLYAEAVEIAQTIYPEGHMHIGFYLNVWAECLLEAGRTDEVEPIARRAYAIFLDVFGESHRLTQRAAASIERSRDGR